MNGVKFSVIMPCYNSAEYVRNAVDSIVSQKYPCWELVAINDGSTDETLDILNSYAENDSRIKVYSKENGGYASAINAGLDVVSGDYFLMMGSDDQFFPDLFKRLTEEIGADLPDMIAFRTVKLMNGISQGIDKATDFYTEASIYHNVIGRYIERYPKHAEIFFARDTSKCYKTKLLSDLRMFGKYGYDADGIFAMLFAHKARSFMSIPVDGYKWTIRSDSVSATTSLPKNLDRLNNWKLFFESTEGLAKEEITLYDVTYARHFYAIAQKTVMMIEKQDSKSINRLKLSINCIPSVFDRYRIEIGIKDKINMCLLIKFPMIWKAYQKARTTIGKTIRKDRN